MISDFCELIVCGNGGDDDDLDTEMVRVKPERPRLIWKDGSFQENTLTALNYMRKNKHFCDVTLQVKENNIRTILRDFYSNDRKQ